METVGGVGGLGSESSKRLRWSEVSFKKASEQHQARKAVLHLSILSESEICLIYTASNGQCFISFLSAVLFILSAARSPSPTLWDTQVHLAHYTPFTTTPITHRYSWSTLPNFLLCCLPGSLFILLAIFLSFMPPPSLSLSQRVRKIVPWEKDNNNLWQCTWVKCPGVMKQLQALTDGPCCKHAAAPVTETANRQMQRHNHIHKPSHSYSYCSTPGRQVTTLI